jgi:ABC-type antimicrobial peptide transport system permease subunit
LVAVGVVIGGAAAVMVGRLLHTLLFDVTPFDPLALVTAGTTFAVVAIAACLIPAYRASRVDLMESLRQA